MGRNKKMKSKNGCRLRNTMGRVVNRKLNIRYEEEVKKGRGERKGGGCASAVPVKVTDEEGFFRLHQ